MPARSLLAGGSRVRWSSHRDPPNGLWRACPGQRGENRRALHGRAVEPCMLKYGLSVAEIREERRMEYARLGNTGLMVSELCLGCMTFGQEADEETSGEILGRFLDAGGNFVDTADVYSNGVSEEITGRALRGIRDDVVLATKVRFPMGKGPNDVGLSRKHIMQGCEDSLRRLGTDFIDLYQVHCWDAATPLEETLSALTDLVRSGKVRLPAAAVLARRAQHRAGGLARLRGGGARCDPLEPTRRRIPLRQVPPR